MNENLITEIEIKNFKCFEDFKANGFKRVNLIGGKNNVGKTALMEAFWINELNKKEGNLVHSFVSLVSSLALMEQLRQTVNYDIQDLQIAFSLLKKFNTMSIQTNNNSLKLNIGVKDLDVTVNINELELDISPLASPHLFREFLSEKTIVSENFIPSDKIDNDLIISLDNRMRKSRKKRKLNQYISEFDRDILEFEIIDNIPKVFLDSKKEFEDISELGHGLKRYISIISAILVCQDSCLFLDEIENGIHYTHQDRLWEIILTLSEELNCQVFATTHSKDCIESYYKVSKKMAYKNVSYVKMTRLESSQISSSVYDYELLENSMEQDHEVRGW
ncbi:MAG: AAA family ATPase [Thiomargarita sp.]|nr:AAA family ATPase [Thiomargarita sp.]